MKTDLKWFLPNGTSRLLHELSTDDLQQIQINNSWHLDDAHKNVIHQILESRNAISFNCIGKFMSRKFYETNQLAMKVA